MDSLLWQQTLTACARNACPSEGNGHNLLYLPRQAERGFATDKASFLSLFNMGTYDIGGGGWWWIEEKGECSVGYGITEM